MARPSVVIRLSGMTLPGNCVPVTRIAQHAVVGGPDDAVGAAQPEREVAVQLGRRRQRLPRRVGEPVDGAVLLAAEEEQPVADDRPADGALEVAELEGRLGPVAVGVPRPRSSWARRTSRRGGRSGRCRCSWLVPLRVTTLTAAPLLRPTSAEKFDVWILTCSMKLRLTLLTCEPFEPESRFDVPSMVRLLVLPRLPLIDWPVTLRLRRERRADRSRWRPRRESATPAPGSCGR